MDIQDTKKYTDAVEDYLDTDIDYCANTIKYADEDDLRQLAQDSFHAGVKWCESQKPDASENILPIANVNNAVCPDCGCNKIQKDTNGIYCLNINCDYVLAN